MAKTMSVSHASEHCGGTDEWNTQGKDLDEKIDSTLDRLLVEFGKEILQIVPGKVSTEVDARFSFDVEGSVKKALHIIEVSLKSYPPISSLLTFSSYTKTLASTNRVSSSSWLRRGRVSRQPTSCSLSTV